MQQEFNMPKKKRSRANPAISLEEAEEHLREVVHELGFGEHHRDSIGRAFGYSSGTSGAGARPIAAMSYYGILARVKGRKGVFETTELAEQLMDEDEATAQKAREVAFLNPALNREIFDRYRGTGRLPRQLAEMMARDHGITSATMNQAAGIFLSSGMYTGLIEPDGAFVDQIRKETTTLAEKQSPSGDEKVSVQDSVDSTDKKQHFDVALTDGKFAELFLPERLNTQDVNILQSVLNVIQAQIEANSGPGRLVNFSAGTSTNKRR